MWIRERQPRTGSWHMHAVVDLGYDIRTNFPHDEVRRRRYANVPRELRKTWKQVRECSERYGFGRTELLPIKRTGRGCARYLTKYLGKALLSEKAVGEERCRLFGVWGGVRFVYSQFDWVSNRILRKRKAWLARINDLRESVALSDVYGKRWWFSIGEALLNVILPIEYYQVPVNGSPQWDELGWFMYQRDCARYSDLDSIEARRRQSLLEFFTAEGKAWDMSPSHAASYAMRRTERVDAESRQYVLDLDSEGSPA